MDDFREAGVASKTGMQGPDWLQPVHQPPSIWSSAVVPGASAEFAQMVCRDSLEPCNMQHGPFI